MTRARRNPYDVLGVDQNASKAEIKKAYYILAKKHHPDKVHGDERAKAEANRIFAEIGAAYETLTNPDAAENFSEKERAYEQQQHRKEYHDGGCYDYGFGEPMFGPDIFFPAPFSQRGMPAEYGVSPLPHFFGGGAFFDMQDPFENHLHFTDPFKLFEETFGQNGLFDDGSVGAGKMAGNLLSRDGPVAVSYTSTSTRIIPDERSGGMKSISTTTQVLNGKKTTKTETTITHPGGHRETYVEIQGDDENFKKPALTHGTGLTQRISTTEHMSGIDYDGDGAGSPQGGVPFDSKRSRLTHGRSTTQDVPAVDYGIREMHPKSHFHQFYADDINERLVQDLTSSRVPSQKRSHERSRHDQSHEPTHFNQADKTSMEESVDVGKKSMRPGMMSRLLSDCSMRFRSFFGSKRAQTKHRSRDHMPSH